MKSRIVGLVVLALLALASLYASSYWTQQEQTPGDRVASSRAEYRMWTWLVTCAIFFGAWIWLLVKTIRYRRAEEYP